MFENIYNNKWISVHYHINEFTCLWSSILFIIRCEVYIKDIQCFVVWLKYFPVENAIHLHIFIYTNLYKYVINQVMKYVHVFL